MSFRESNVFGSIINETVGLHQLKELVKDMSTCFACKCFLNKENSRKFDFIEIIGVNKSSNIKHTGSNFRIMNMDLIELTMLEESGIKIIVSNELLKVN